MIPLPQNLLLIVYNSKLAHKMIKHQNKKLVYWQAELFNLHFCLIFQKTPTCGVMVRLIHKFRRGLAQLPPRLPLGLQSR